MYFIFVVNICMKYQLYVTHHNVFVYKISCQLSFSCVFLQPLLLHHQRLKLSPYQTRAGVGFRNPNPSMSIINQQWRNLYKIYFMRANLGIILDMSQGVKFENIYIKHLYLYRIEKPSHK